MDILFEDDVLEDVAYSDAGCLHDDSIAKFEQRIDADGNVYTRVYKKPDEDFYSAITGDELLVRVRKNLKEFFANK